MADNLPDIRRHLEPDQGLAAARHLPNGVRVSGPDAGAIALAVDLLATTPAIRYVSQYTYAVADFTVDTLEQLTDPDRSGLDADTLRGAVARLSRGMADTMVRLDEELSEARTGRLIRIFLVADHGAAHCNEVSLSRHLAAVSLFSPGDGLPLDAARDADRGTAALTNELRRALGQRPLDYGGWLAQAEAGPAPAEPGGTTVVPRVTASEPEAADAGLRHVDSRELHYVAVYRRGEEIAAVDVMHHPGLRRFLYGKTVDERRRFYSRFGSRIGRYITDLTISAEPVIGPALRHVVFDVERGAVYFHRLSPSTYIVGVSLDQDQVGTAELKIADLARDLLS